MERDVMLLEEILPSSEESHKSIVNRPCPMDGKANSSKHNKTSETSKLISMTIITLEILDDFLIVEDCWCLFRKEIINSLLICNVNISWKETFSLT